MKRSPVNQINASFIDILRIKWLVFFYCGRLSSAQRDRWQAMAYYRPAPGRTDGIPERSKTSWQWIYKFVFTNSWLVHQRHIHVSWIKGLGKNPQKEWTRSLLAVPFIRGHPTVTPRTPRNDGVYTCQSPWWHATRGVFTSLLAKTHQNRNACVDAPRSVARK